MPYAAPRVQCHICRRDKLLVQGKGWACRNDLTSKNRLPTTMTLYSGTPA